MDEDVPGVGTEVPGTGEASTGYPQFEAMLNTLIAKCDDETHALRQAQAAEEEREVRRVAREQIQVQSQRITPCDGTSPSKVRTWLSEMDLAGPYLHSDYDIVMVATNTSTHALRQAIERYQSRQEDRQLTTWATLRHHISEGFLTADEGQHLREMVKRIRQIHGEPISYYNRRFEEAADKAYPVRSPSDERYLSELYIRGVTDRPLLRPILEREVTTLGELMERAVECSRQEERIARFLKEEAPTLQREDEPMEVGGVRASEQRQAASPHKLSEESPDLTALQRQIAELTLALSQRRGTTTPCTMPREQRTRSPSPVTGVLEKRVKRVAEILTGHAESQDELYRWCEALEDRIATAARRDYPRRRNDWTRDGLPVCWECGGVGHMRRKCPTLHWTQSDSKHDRPQSHSSQPQQAPSGARRSARRKKPQATPSEKSLNY